MESAHFWGVQPGKIIVCSVYIYELYRLVHVVLDFGPWDVMTKVRYFLMVQIYNLGILEVEHDLETSKRP